MQQKELLEVSAIGSCETIWPYSSNHFIRQGGETVLEETLKSVKAAEAKAEEILREADAKAASVLEEAKVKAQAMREDTAQKVRSLNQKTTQAVQEEGNAQLDAASREAGKEIEALRELIVPKKPEAVEAIISALV